MRSPAHLLLPLALGACDPGSGAEEDTTPAPAAATTSHSPSCDAKGTPSPHPDLATLCTTGVAAFIGSLTYSTIQDAIDDAASGDTLYLCPGTFTERLSVDTLNITLASASGDADDTILDGEGVHQLLEASKTELTLYNLTLQDGLGSRGGAIEAESAVLDIQCVTFRDNVASVSGGAVDFDKGTLSIENSTFKDNLSEGDGGAIRWGGNLDSTISLESVLFEANSADEDGGALHLGGTSRYDIVEITDTTFFENEAGVGGGAITLDGEQVVSVLVWGSSFTGNTAEDEGGAILVSGERYTEYDIWLDDLLLEANIAPSGAAVEISDTPAMVDLDLYGSAILDNESDSGAAVRTSDDTVLWSYESDWGVRGDALDNEGDDLSSQCGDFDSLQSAETFLCSLDGRWTTPS